MNQGEANADDNSHHFNFYYYKHIASLNVCQDSSTFLILPSSAFLLFPNDPKADVSILPVFHSSSPISSPFPYSLNQRKHLDLVSVVASLPQCLVLPCFENSTLKKQARTHEAMPAHEFWDTHTVFFFKNIILRDRGAVSVCQVSGCVSFFHS